MCVLVRRYRYGVRQCHIDDVQTDLRDRIGDCHLYRLGHQTTAVVITSRVRRY